MPSIKPVFIDTVTHIPALWANAVSDLVYDVFDQATTKTGVRAALELGTMAIQNANNVQIVGGSVNNAPIGLDVPMQGRFTVLRVDVDPIDPLHAVNKRYLNLRLDDVMADYLPLSGGTLTGPLLAHGDPVEDFEVVHRKWLDGRIRQKVPYEEVFRRTYIASIDQDLIYIADFTPPAHVTVYAANFMVYINGSLKSPDIHYTIDLSTGVEIYLVDPTAQDDVIEIIYFNNLRNDIEVPVEFVP